MRPPSPRHPHLARSYANAEFNQASCVFVFSHVSRASSSCTQCFWLVCLVCARLRSPCMTDPHAANDLTETAAATVAVGSPVAVPTDAAATQPSSPSNANKKKKISKCRFCRQALPDGVTFSQHLESCPKLPDRSAPKICRFCNEKIPDDVDFAAHNDVCRMRPEPKAERTTALCSICGTACLKSEFSVSQKRRGKHRKCNSCVASAVAVRRIPRPAHRKQESAAAAAPEP